MPYTDADSIDKEGTSPSHQQRKSLDKGKPYHTKEEDILQGRTVPLWPYLNKLSKAMKDNFIFIKGSQEKYF